MTIDIQAITKDLKLDEGFRGQPYTCSSGKWTIGYGWNLEARPISEKIAELILVDQIFEAVVDCERAFQWFHSLSSVRKGVIINMTFNIGITRLLGFKKTIAYIETGMFNKAALEMLDSKWARQVGRRADRLSAQMREG